MNAEPHDRRMPHLALVTAHPGPIGGMEKFARFLARTALSAGWRVTVALSGEDLFSGMAGAVRVERVDWLDATFRGDREYRASTILDRRRWFRRVRPDVAVFVQSSNTPFRAAVVGAALARVPVVTTHRTLPYVIAAVPSRRHFFGLLPGLGLYARRMVARTWLTAALAARVVFNSEQVRREYERCYRYPQSRGVVIANAVDAPERPEGPTGTGGPLTIGFVGRISREKRIDVLLEAVAAMRSSRCVQLAFWGDGDKREILIERAGELGLSGRVEWNPPTPDVWPAYGRCDVVVLCSPRESSSNMILEAMAAGCAVVVTDVGGMRELVADGEAGMIVPPEEPAALAAALDRLAGDDALRRRLGARAREEARRAHDPLQIGRQWLDTLEQVCRRSVRSARGTIGSEESAAVTEVQGVPLNLPGV